MSDAAFDNLAVGLALLVWAALFILGVALGVGAWAYNTYRRVRGR